MFSSLLFGGARLAIPRTKRLFTWCVMDTIKQFVIFPIDPMWSIWMACFVIVRAGNVPSARIKMCFSGCTLQFGGKLLCSKSNITPSSSITDIHNSLIYSFRCFFRLAIALLPLHYIVRHRCTITIPYLSTAQERQRMWEVECWQNAMNASAFGARWNVKPRKTCTTQPSECVKVTLLKSVFRKISRIIWDCASSVLVKGSFSSYSRLIFFLPRSLTLASSVRVGLFAPKRAKRRPLCTMLR